MLKLKGLLEKSEGEITGIASTDDFDRQGESIKQDGWDLKSFKKNPVILASHNYSEFPIGKATGIAVQDNKLTFKMVFSEATQTAKEAYQLVKEGILKSFSVGFIPREYDSKDANVITKAELLEISLVAVPANPNAIVIAKGMKDNALAQNLIKGWLLDDKLKSEVDEIEKEEVNDELPIECEEEVECECGKKYKFTGKKSTSEVVDHNKENGEESAEVAQKELDVKLLQKTTGYLQELLHDIKKGGAK
jgi:HK97 family phage prohead protease